MTEAGRAYLDGVRRGFTAPVARAEEAISLIEAEAVAAALSTLRARVEGMRWAPDSDEDEETEWVDRAAVLAVIDEAMG